MYENLDQFIDGVNCTIADGDMIDFCLHDGAVVSVKFEDLALYVDGDDYTKQGYQVAYDKYMEDLASGD